MGDHRVPSHRPSVRDPLAGLDDNLNPLPPTRRPTQAAHQGTGTGAGSPVRAPHRGITSPHAGAALGAVERRSPHFEVGSLHTRLEAAGLQLSRLDPNPKLHRNNGA